MGRKGTPSLNLLRCIQTTNGKERSKGLDEGEDGHERERPMSSMDRLFHDPGPNFYIVAIFAMKTPINIDLFKSELVHVMVKNHRFSSLQVMKKENGSMVWVPRPLNIDNHVIVPEIDTSMESSVKFVNDYISNLSKSRIDYSKPLWDVHILNTKTSDAQGKCVFRFHHSLGDGMSLMNLLLSSSRKASDPKALPTLPGNSNKLSNHSHKLVSSFKYRLMVFWNSLVACVMFILTALFLKDTETPLKVSLGSENRSRRFVLTTVSLDDIKMVKRAMNVTVNDVILGVVHAGVYRFLNHKYGAGAGENDNKVPKKIRFRAMFFFNLRASTKVDVLSNASSKNKTWGNKVGGVFLPLQMTPREDPSDYVREIKTIMEHKKASFEPYFTPFFTHWLIKIFGVKAAINLIYRVQTSTTLWFSNVPGPQEEILFCGHEVAYVAPTCYGIPSELLIHAVSYVDKMIFVISVDEKSIPDPETLSDDLQTSLNLIKTSVLATKSVKS